MPVAVSHILTNVPFADVVAISLPDGVNDSDVSAVVCATITGAVCFIACTPVGAEALLSTGFVFGGGFRDLGSGHGGKCIN